MQKLYKRDNTGSTRIWWAEIDGRSYRLNSGKLDGKIIKSEWSKCDGKNVGRSNGTTPEEQCLVEVEALYTKKRKRGYTQTLSKIDDAKESLIAPMLAHRWEDHHHKIDWDEIVASQPKLDGIRCIGREDGLWTRKGESITSLPHIARFISQLCRVTGFVFDGELYNHELKDDFNKITSLVKRQKISKSRAEEIRDLVEYHIYDLIMPNSDFIARISYAEKALQKSPYFMKIVPTKIVESPSGLDTIYGDYLGQGYEGQMIRRNGLYMHKRTDMLLKRKEFQDEEFPIEDIIEGKGNRSGMVGSIVLRLNKKQTFNAALMGTDNYRRMVLKNKDVFIGCEATVKFFHYTPDGKPRFPVVKVIHT